MNRKNIQYVKNFLGLNVLKIILIALKEFICNPNYWGIQTGTATEEMSMYLKISSMYDLYICKIGVPIISILIVYTFSKILYVIMSDTLK